MDHRASPSKSGGPNGSQSKWACVIPSKTDRSVANLKSESAALSTIRGPSHLPASASPGERGAGVCLQRKLGKYSYIHDCNRLREPDREVDPALEATPSCLYRKASVAAPQLYSLVIRTSRNPSRTPIRTRFWLMSQNTVEPTSSNKLMCSHRQGLPPQEPLLGGPDETRSSVALTPDLIPINVKHRGELAHIRPITL